MPSSDLDAMNARATELVNSYRATGDLDSLEQAVTVIGQIAAATPADDPDLAKRHKRHANALEKLARNQESAESIPQLVRAWRETVAATRSGDPDRAWHLHKLANALRIEDIRTEDDAVLAEAIELAREALALVPSSHPDRVIYLENLAGALRKKAERTEDNEALAEAIELGREVVALIPSGHRLRALYLGNHADSLSTEALRTDDCVTLAEVAGLRREALALTPAEDEDRPERLADLATALSDWAVYADDAAIAAEAVSYVREVLAATAPDDPDRLEYLWRLAYLQTIVAIDAEDEDIYTEAVQTIRAAESALQGDDYRRPLLLDLRAAVLAGWHEKTDEPELLIAAVRAKRDALLISPPDDPDRADGVELLQVFKAALGDLSPELRSRGEQIGAVSVLTAAVSACREVLAASEAAGHPAEPDDLGELSMSLRVLGARTGDAAMLAEAVRVARAAVAAAPPGHSERRACLGALALALELAGQRGDIRILREAVDVHHECLALITDDEVRAAAVSNLSNTLASLAERTGELATLREAVQASRDAVAVMPEGDSDRSVYLNNLGFHLSELALRTSDQALLREVIDIERQALASTPVDHTESMHLRQNNLGGSLHQLGNSTGDRAALAEAVERLRAAVAAVPHDHPRVAMYQRNLGLALRDLAARTGDDDAVSEAWACFGAAVRNELGDPATRIRGSRDLARLAASQGEARAALRALESAVRTTALLAPEAFARSDREHHIGQFAGLAAEAAAAAIEVRRPERAVELLEQARGILVADAIGARGSDGTRLAEEHPDFAARLTRLRNMLDAPDDPRAGLEDTRELAERRREAYTEWQELLPQIRALPGFEGFLLAAKIDDLARLADDGPVVMLNTGPTRCDALILSAQSGEPVRLMPLKDLTAQNAAGQVTKLRDACHAVSGPASNPAARAKAQQDISAVLAWLWDTVTGPVLEAIADGNPARVWWCPVGALAQLPLHAAGHHEERPGRDAHGESGRSLGCRPRTVLDRVVSSYTPTLRSLAYARSQSGRLAGSTVVVAVPDAPGTPELRGVVAESRALMRLMPDATVLARPTRERTLAALTKHQVAHFACHGHADSREPGASKLVLYDYWRAPLTVADVAALRLSAGLAFLSACDTTVTTQTLADEAVHIAGAFHLAGYQNVIGTLWPIDDRATVRLVENFYSHLTDGGTSPPDPARSAVALHHATRDLRDNYLDQPDIWAGFTHTGA